MLSTWKVVVIAVLAALAQILIRNLFFRPKNIPGPFWARFTRLWLLFGFGRGDFDQVNIRLHQEYATAKNPGERAPYYAPVVRVGPNMYSLSEAPKNVYGITSKMEKSKWYDGFLDPSNPMRNLFTLRDIHQHAVLRKKLQNVYSLSSMLSYETYVDNSVELFQERLGEMATGRCHQADDCGYVDFGHWLQCYAFDVIAELTLSKRLGFLDKGEDIDGLIRTIDGKMCYMCLIGLYIWLSPYIFRLLTLLPGDSARGIQKIVGFAAALYKQRKTKRQSGQEHVDPEAPRDVLDRLLDNQMDEKRNISDIDIIGASLANIGAGSDTTASSLSGIMFHLIQNPACLDRLREEVADATSAGRCEETKVSFQASQEMPYLQAVIKEGLRMQGAVGLPMWRVVGKGGADVLGHWLPEGSEVGVNPWVAHFNRDVWGDDVNQFRPERWIEAESNPEKLKMMEKNHIPFGSGSRTCLGRHIAFLEISKIVPQISRLFDFELKHPDQTLNNLNLWFVKPVNFRVKVRAIGAEKSS